MAQSLKMWYASSMPATLPQPELDEAALACSHAHSVRALHRRRTEKGSAQREEDIRLALERLREVMRPLRSHIARFPTGPQTEAADANRAAIRKMSAAVQRERRKLWKMKKKGDNEQTIRP